METKKDVSRKKREKVSPLAIKRRSVGCGKMWVVEGNLCIIEFTFFSPRPWEGKGAKLRTKKGTEREKRGEIQQILIERLGFFFNISQHGSTPKGISFQNFGLNWFFFVGTLSALHSAFTFLPRHTSPSPLVTWNKRKKKKGEEGRWKGGSLYLAWSITQKGHFFRLSLSPPPPFSTLLFSFLFLRSFSNINMRGGEAGIGRNFWTIRGREGKRMW